MWETFRLDILTKALVFELQIKWAFSTFPSSHVEVSY
jgi:hypothetical protein